ncbi:FecR domain-containing protein [Candidatus Peregrinibacteria bacterium]|nr:FecR domain-containing protein [Candidatus Peregrinibacteria bacterium]
MKFLFYFWRKKGDLASLVKTLDEIPKIFPSEHFRKECRGKLLSFIESRPTPVFEDPLIHRFFGQLVDRIQNTSRNVQIDLTLKASLRERVYVYALSHSLKNLTWIQFFSGNKRPLAAVAFIAFLFVFVLPFGFFSHKDPFFQATYLEALGKVFVERHGELIEVDDRILLQEGDTITTTLDSQASIYFFDDSVSRLSKNTAISVNELKADTPLLQENIVQLEVKKGRMWSNVAPFPENSASFTVKSPTTIASSKTTASFDVSVSDNDVTVIAFNNSVDVQIADKNQVVQKVMVEGESVTVAATTEKQALLSMDRPEVDEWISFNAQEDEKYQEQVKRIYQASLQGETNFLPGDILYPVKKFSENAKIVFSFDSIEKEKAKLRMAKQRFIEANNFISSGDFQKSKKLVYESQNVLEEVSADFRIFKQTDPQTASILGKQILISMNEYKKTLRFNEGDALLQNFSAILDKIALDVVDDDIAAKIQLELDLAFHSLLVAKRYFNKNHELLLAHMAFEAYRKYSNNVIEDLQTVPSAERNFIIRTVFEQKVKELLFFRMLENVSLSQPMIKLLKGARAKLLFDVNRIILASNLSLSDILSEVLGAQRDDEVVQSEIFTELALLISDDFLRSQIERFQKFYLSNNVVELISKDEIITTPFVELILNLRATPEAEAVFR